MIYLSKTSITFHHLRNIQLIVTLNYKFLTCVCFGFRSVASSSVSRGYPPQQQGYHQFSSPHSYGPKSSSDLPPPKIDRSSKPSSASRPLRSAQERLFGSREGDINGLDAADGGGAGGGYPHGTPNGAPSQHDYIGSLRGSSLDRERAAKAVR